MINISQIAAGRLDQHLGKMRNSKTPLSPATILAGYSSFTGEVFNAAQPQNSSGVPAELAWLHLAHSPTLMRGLAAILNGKQNSSGPEDSWRNYLTELAAQKGGEFVNLSTGNLQRVGVFHTPAVVDWLGLLADIGRGARFAHALGLPLHAMLADTSWMCANRSVFAIEHRRLTEDGAILRREDIIRLLDENCATRRSLYDTLGIITTVEGIPPYERPNTTIHRESLLQIAEYYVKLASDVYGLTGALDQVQKIRVGKNPRPKAGDEDIPGSIGFLTASRALEGQSGEADLDILGTVAQHFSSFELEVFVYFFAQLFAQLQYLGNTLKVAVFSEKRFDSSFDKLAPYLPSRWPNAGLQPSSNLLAAAYAPQYSLNDKEEKNKKREGLPYNVISLDVVQSLRGENGRLPVLLKSVGAFNYELSLAEFEQILKNTNTIALGQLISDLTSFLLLCQRTCPAALRDACNLAQCKSDVTELKNGVAEIFEQLGVGPSWHIESIAKAGAETADLWRNWLDMASRAQDLPYTPLHLWPILQNEWREEQYRWLACIALVAKNVYQLITNRDWVGTLRQS